MARHVLILSASLRAGSNSEALANAFAGGARAAGHTVELVSLRGKNIAFCRGCLACQTLGRCVIGDDAVAITEKMLRERLDDEASQTRLAEKMLDEMESRSERKEA